MPTSCEHLMIDTCSGRGMQVGEFNDDTDHAHPLVQYPPNIAVTTLVNQLKDVSPRERRQQHPDQVRKYLWSKHFWSPSYFAASRDRAPLSIIKQHIEPQNRPDLKRPTLAAQKGSLSSHCERPGLRRRRSCEFVNTAALVILLLSKIGSYPHRPNDRGC